MANSANELNIYLDESGDFGPFEPHSPLYLFSFVFEEPSSSFDCEEKRFQKRVSRLSGGDHFIHVGNLVRAEPPYEKMLREARTDLFSALYFFYLHSGLRFACIRVRKEGVEGNDGVELTLRIAESLGQWINRNLGFLQSFDSIKIHYDFGQPNLIRAVLASFAANGFKPVIIRQRQDQSILLQTADLICNIELLSFKSDQGKLSHSDIAFFGQKRKIKKDLIKPIGKYRID